ncbi:TPA: hypothetical protein N0F65_007679 [Lagenidium giganteum]|uniref:Uncharacterized protein n=1 Tax=Lagenidium giganteum TaxID=4803 RepID=A0AAV2Z9S4_9STRA|nr:TPA: hypothetical protein N0F65_007679 [Lagenidium giganteum]
MVQENVVEALILLSKAEDKATRLNCVTAFMNLSHVCELRQVIVQQGAVKMVSEIATDTDDRTLRTACAITLSNLCCLDGEEETLVEDGVIGALSMLINEHPRVSGICLGALFNLTCVHEPYQKIETVVKIFLTLAASGSSAATPTFVERSELIAKALCNLSNFKKVRPRLLEEGVVNAISSLLHGSNGSVPHMVAYVLLNLSAIRACRAEMVAKGCMTTLVALTAAASEYDTKVLIGSILWNLSKDASNRLQMVVEGVLLLLQQLIVCANTLYNISSSEETRGKMVERDAVSVIDALSKKSKDGEAKRMCTLSLCNLLSVQQAAADIVGYGAINALVDLSVEPGQPLETRHLFAKALHGLCEQPSTREAAVSAGIVSAIVTLSGVESTEVTDQRRILLGELRARCTAALACLAADDRFASSVSNITVVQCITKILVLERANVAIERFCCSCLSLLCRDEKCSLMMTDVGAIEVVLATCTESRDLETKASCCHVLASMSCHPSCCMALVRMGIISVLATLAKLKGDTGVQRCCAITLANLSNEPEIRSLLVSAGTVSILSVLSNSYSEESQRDCAKILCNLSNIHGKETHLVDEGSINVLMMISMVRALNINTKESCIRAMFNLLNSQTMKPIVQEGLVKILPALSALESKTASEISTMLFCKLLEHDIGRNALCSEKPALKALFTLMERIDHEENVIHIHEDLLVELVYHENSRVPSVRAGIIDAVHKIAMRLPAGGSMDDMTKSCTGKKLALVLFSLSTFDDTRLAVASSSGLATLGTFLKLHKPRKDCDQATCALYAVSTFCWLAWHDPTRSRLDHPEISTSLVGVLGIAAASNQSPGLRYPFDSVRCCILTLCCLAQTPDHVDVMLNDHLVDSLNGIFDPSKTRYSVRAREDSQLVALTCNLLRQLSHAPRFAKQAASIETNSQIVTLFCTLATLVSKHRDAESALDCAEVLCSIAFIEGKKRQGGTFAKPIFVDALQPPGRLVKSDVLAAIKLLVCDNNLLETRWRCTASLWALSTVPEYRHQLVMLGCTSILVGETARPEIAASANSLKSCAGTLSNLTNVVPELADRNAAKMVSEDAVPALIALARMASDNIRDYCTSALSNLSSQSPKVESGAVSALLNLSLRSQASPSTPPPVSPTLGGMSEVIIPQDVFRPPLVYGARYKSFSSLPHFEVQVPRDDSLFSRKFECNLPASTPPPPHLPTIPPENEVGGVGHDNGVKKHDDQVKRKASLLAELGQIKSATDSDGHTYYPKIDSTESRLLLDTDEDGNPIEGGKHGLTSQDLHGMHDEHRDVDVSEQDDSPGQLKKVISGSSLPRVITRKTAGQSGKKLKDLKDHRSRSEKRLDVVGSSHMIMSPEDCSTPELESPMASANLSVLNVPSLRRGMTLGKSSSKLFSDISTSDASTAKGGMLTPELERDQENSKPTESTGAPFANDQDAVRSNGQSTIAAAAAAALLYSFGQPEATATAELSNAAVVARSVKSKKAAPKSSARESTTNTKQKKSRNLSNKSSPPKIVEKKDVSSSTSTYSDSVEDFQAQAKRLGLWN